MNMRASLALLSIVEAAWAKDAEKALHAPMRAGGPGSGRHKEVLENKGFQKVPVRSSMYSLYKHDSLGTVHVFSDGKWEHEPPSGGIKTRYTGKNADDLKVHLWQYDKNGGR